MVISFHWTILFFSLHCDHCPLESRDTEALAAIDVRKYTDYEEKSQMYVQMC